MAWYIRILCCYLNGVFDGIGEVLEGTDRNSLLRGILGRGVGLGEVGNDDLGVALGAEGAGLEQRLAVVDTATVNVFTGFDIVQRVCDTRQRLEKVIVVNVLSVRTDTFLVNRDLALQLRVHRCHGSGSAFRFQFLNFDPCELIYKV